MSPIKKSGVALRIIVSIVVLALGIVGMQILAKMKKPPSENVVQESKIKVRTVIAESENVDVFIKGFGEVIALKTVNLAPEIGGKLVRIHPRMEVGEMVKRGELLFEIDNRDYLALLEESRASVMQTENSIVRLKKELEISETRLQTLVRNQNLVKDEFERIKALYEKKNIGTKSNVDAAERSYIAATDQVIQMKQALETYPLRIRESTYLLHSANARLTRAETNLKRCIVRAPFSGRLKSVSIETGQYVAPGQPVLSLVDDSIQEIRIPLDSVDARNWLQFKTDDEGTSNSWFGNLKPLPVEIRWTEETDGHVWEGRLDRVTTYDKQTRTLTVAVRIEQPMSITNGSLPLVEGMFCSVSIPGKSMGNVFRLPRWAVSFKNTVYLAEGNRLKTVPVRVARIQDDEVFVQSGIKAGDKVITTRLADPLENSLLEIITP